MVDVALPKALESYVKQLVASGRYDGTDEVIRDALRMKMTFDVQHAALLTDIDIGWRQADQGSFAPYDLAQLLKELDSEAPKTQHA